MAQVEMEIDSVRRGMLKEEWTIVLKERKGKHYLPIFVNKSEADLIGRELLYLVKRHRLPGGRTTVNVEDLSGNKIRCL